MLSMRLMKRDELSQDDEGVDNEVVDHAGGACSSTLWAQLVVATVLLLMRVVDACCRNLLLQLRAA